MEDKYLNEEQNLFNSVLSGKKLETTKKAMPHQDEMQILVGKKLKEIFKDNQRSRLEVVELGTGIGFTSQKIIDADERINLVSVDKELKMIEEAKENLKSYIDNGRIEIKEIGALEFLTSLPDNSVDSVASGFILHNFLRDYREKRYKKFFAF